jgi:hypothetical protein
MSVSQSLEDLPVFEGDRVTAGDEPAVVTPEPEPAAEPEAPVQPQPGDAPDPEVEPVIPARVAPEGPIGERIPPQAELPRDEIERLDPQPLKMELVSGTPFDLEPLKLRQFLRLLRIITRGAADVLDQTSIDFDNPDAFVQQFLGMVMFSIPEAEEETVEFIKSMVKPANMTGNVDKDLIKVRELLSEIENPDLNDVITITQAIIEKEAEDLRALGKRLGSMFAVAQKMGVTGSNAATQTSIG